MSKESRSDKEIAAELFRAMAALTDAIRIATDVISGDCLRERVVTAERHIDAAKDILAQEAGIRTYWAMCHEQAKGQVK